MGDIVAVYTIKGTIGWAPVTKIVYVFNGSIDTADPDCAEFVKYSDGSDGTGWAESA